MEIQRRNAHLYGLRCYPNYTRLKQGAEYFLHIVPFNLHKRFSLLTCEKTETLNG